MKVAHISSSNIHSGSGRAAYRIHKALTETEVDSQLFLLNKYSDDLNINSVTDTWLQKALKKVRPCYERKVLNLYRDREKKPFSIANRGINVAKERVIRDAEIINLHWINKCFLSLKSLKKIGKLNKPIVWTLHDMWAFTGGCHYSNSCRRYEESCGKCPVLHSEKLKDLSWKILSRKIKVFKDLNLTIVTPSNWLADCAKRSTLFRNNRIEVIPYPVNTRVFKPIDKETARKILNLPERKLLILFGISPTASKERKGIDYLIESLLITEHKYPKLSEKSELLIMGINRSEKIENLPFKAHFLGVLHDDITINLCYNAADIYILPSTEDNLPNTVIESLSCGTPALGFKVGGVPDIINHKENGYLAEQKNTEDLAEGLKWALEDKDKLIGLNKKAREKVLNFYTYEIIGKKYLNLYESLLK
jgi:glycosyltransferase involved in cell wall biosynthesis